MMELLLFGNLSKRARFLRSRELYRVISFSRCFKNQAQLNAQKDESMEPIKFTTSAAANWKAIKTRSGGSSDDSPSFQPYVVSLSVAVFLIYFCALREENDIDKELGRTLYDRIDGLEEHQLRMTMEYNKDHGLPTEEIELRLTELEHNNQP